MEPTSNAANIKATTEKAPAAFSVHAFEEVELPQSIEKQHEDFITYGADNMFPMHMIQAWLQSPIHNALTTGITQMIAGEGLKFETPIPDAELFAKRVNRHGDTLDDLINKTAFDLYMHGYFGWQYVWNTARTKIVGIYHTPAEQIRSGKADDEGVINEYFVSYSWSQWRKKKFAPTRIPAWDPSDRSIPKQMNFVKQYRPAQFYYSTPSYIGGMNWILMDNRIGEFHLNNIENGFFPSAVVQFFNGEPPPEQKAAIERGFMQKFSGKQSAKIVFVYNNNRDQQVTFDTYEGANIDKRFRDLMPEVAKNIMIAHRVPSPLLFGIRESTGLGNNAEELESSSLLMNKMVIMPFQKIILDTLREVFKINGWNTELTIETLQPGQWLEGKDADAESTTDAPGAGDPTVTPDGPTADAIPEGVLPADIQKTALNGAQISSLLEVIQNVAAGTLSKASAKAIITASFPTFTPEQVNEVVDNIVVNAAAFRSMDMRKPLPDNMVDPLLKHLSNVGTPISELEEQGYTLVAIDDDMTAEGAKKGLKREMFSTPYDPATVDPGEPQDQTTGMYLVRYQYRAGTGEEPIIETSRTFCTDMMTANASTVYTVDEINGMQNPEFGDYDIFEFKGSYNCRHRWARLVWFRIPTQAGKVPGYRQLRPGEIPVSFLPENDGEATRVNDKVQK